LACNVWLHRNLSGYRDQLASLPPLCLQLNGVALFPQAVGNAPRLPLLGLRALVLNRLRVTIDCEHRLVSLEAP
jgi:hypothetical protein